VSVAVGASVEQKIGTFLFGKETSESMNGPMPYIPCFAEVPAGSRLSLMCSNSGANDASYDGLIFAVS